ncbi:MAG: tyrosine-protein phosphatase [Desulfobulbus sp.]|nr:tyrosine-protein phosphatase [Desulfobulbus sp.]
MSDIKIVCTRNILLGALAMSPCLSSTSASALEAILSPILSTAPNFRDLAGISASNGGSGFVDTTSHGGVMRTGVFYRTNALNKLSHADWITLSALHIDRDIDLRTPDEIYGTLVPPSAAAQDVVPEGATWTNINIYGTQGPIPSPFWETPANAVSFMQSGYQAFVSDPVQQNGFRTVLLTLANDAGPDVWHCSGGKDRTGWTSVLLQSIAGVSEATIMQGYLATNSYIAELIGTTKAYLLAKYPGWDPETIDALQGVQSNYLQAGLDQVVASYGSMSAYLTQGIGLTQADLYVLRAKMVYYSELPGQSGFVGNAASGAAFLNALQNSPLSGHYTDYNYYLQSAVDQGTLGGVETRVGGQVYADAASFLLRQPQRFDEVITPYTSGRDLPQGKTRMWMTGNGDNYSISGHDGLAGSTENSGGSIIGATHRISNRASATMGLGYNWGSVDSAGTNATVNTVLGTLGGRYGFSALDAGPFIEGRADAGWVDYESERSLGGGLGAATGSTTGVVYSGQVRVGNAIRLIPLTLTPQVGVRVSGVSLDGFNEGGSDLALSVHGIDETFFSLLADLDFSLDPKQLGEWTIVPVVTLGYERILGDPQVESTATLYGFTIRQESAYDSHDLMKASVGLSAEQGAFTVKGRVSGVMGDEANSTGISGLLSLAYSF